MKAEPKAQKHSLFILCYAYCFEIFLRLFKIGNRLLLWGQLPKPDLDRDTPCLMWAAPSKADKHENEYSYNVNTVEPDVYDLLCR